ncbi:MAG: transporter substrate-binding domain-containing protein [Clostridia bacterium]|nr:transporter substrate-binding domain-containing protein [Clostridia bacterium]
MKKLLTIMLTLVLAFTAAMALTACKDDGDQLKLINVPLGDEQYAFAMKMDNVALETSFNEYLAEIKADGTFDAIMAKYFENKGTKVGYNYVGDGTGTNEAGDVGAGKFVVATNCPFSPFEYIENGKIYGVDMEIAAGYASKMGLELIIKNIDFDAILPSLDAGYADIGMAGMTVSPDRAGYRFTTKYFNASLNIIVAADNTDFDNCTTQAEVEAVLAGLTGKKIGYQNGTTSVDYVAGFTNIEGKGYDSAALAAYDVINGNIYAVVVDNAPAAAIVASYN